MQFVMRLAREFRRADWRRMLSEMSATELGEWGDYFRMQSFSDVWMDAQFASLKALIVRMVSGSSDAAVADFSLLPEENGIPERTDEELMHLGEGISGGVRYGYRPRRGDRVVYDGQQWTVTRHERFNGKPMIFIE